jgi:anti-sigma regulatory factor (Ser/Thr protein kinase)
MATTLELKLAPGPKAASAARIALHDLREILPPDLLGEVRLMVSELVTNSIRHAGPDQPGPIALRASVDEELLCVEVEDTGPGFRPSEAPARGTEAGGWGLYIVQTLADRWGVGHEGKPARVWFEIDLRRRKDSSPGVEATQPSAAARTAPPSATRRESPAEHPRSRGGPRLVSSSA